MNVDNSLVVPLMATAVVMLLFASFFIIAQRSHKKMQAAWAHVAERFGLTNHNADGIYPVYNGRLHHVEIGLDVIYQTYTTSRDVGSGKRPWTRTYAKLSQPPPFQLRSRHQQAAKPDLPIRPTGDPIFDERYELFAPKTMPIDTVLSPELKAILLNANPPVHIMNNLVFWTHIKIVRDAEMLEQALRTCAEVAAVVGVCEGVKR